jgi:predicted short-subunit dehydrogenase-like oxidoreductase (DUF2520 family)
VSSKAPSVFVYGAGRVGLAIANLARERGVDVVGLWNPHPLKPRRAALAKGFDLAINGQPPAIRADLWLIAVPDDAICAIAERLAAAAGPRPAVAAHCAGAHPASLLQSLSGDGVACGSWHPAMTFRGAETDPAALAVAVVALEGEDAAVASLEAFTEALGLGFIHVPAERKPQYHAALVLVANGRVALDAAAARLLLSAGIDAETARDVIAPLVGRTDENLAVKLPDKALTGPVARGDVKTVREQLDALAPFPKMCQLYRALGVVALELVPERVRGEGHRQVAELIADHEDKREEAHAHASRHSRER